MTAGVIWFALVFGREHSILSDLNYEAHLEALLFHHREKSSRWAKLFIGHGGTRCLVPVLASFSYLYPIKENGLLMSPQYELDESQVRDQSI